MTPKVKSGNVWLWQIQIIIIAMAIILTSGCATIPAGKFQELQNSSQTIFLNTTNTFARIERMQNYYEVVIAPDDKLTITTFDPPLVAGKSTDIIPELHLRETALGTVVKYIDVLAAFSTKDYLTQVDNASIALAGSLQNLSTDSKTFTSKDAKKAEGVFATVVDMIGREVVRNKREKALKVIMSKTQNDLKTLTDLIAKDNDKFGKDVDIMINRIVAHENAVRPAYGSLERINFDQRAFSEILEAKPSWKCCPSARL